MVLIIVSVVVILYIIYFVLKCNSKYKVWEIVDIEIYGSVIWGDLKELSDYYFSINVKDFIIVFNKSIKVEVFKLLVDWEKLVKGGD